MQYSRSFGSLCAAHRSGYPMDKVRFVRGKVEDTLPIPSNLPEKIAVLRLDTDWYDSTLAEFNVLVPRLSEGGLLLIDDYCSWGGARDAADTWLNAHPGVFEFKVRGKLHAADATNSGCFIAWRTSAPL